MLPATRAARASLPCAVTDLSDAFVTIALEGPQAIGVLARGCGLDLRAGSFGVKACARTRLAQLPVLIRKSASARFELIIDRSAAQYLEDWLRDASIGIGQSRNRRDPRRASLITRIAALRPGAPETPTPG